MGQPTTTTTTTDAAATRSGGPPSSSSGGASAGARVQLKRHLGAMGFDAQEAQLKPAGGSSGADLQLKRAPSAPIQLKSAGTGGRRVQRRVVQRVGPGNTPPSGNANTNANTNTNSNTNTSTSGNTDASTSTPAEETWSRQQITAWRQEFEIKIGNSLTGESGAVANEMLTKVIAYMEEKHGSLEPSAAGYRQSVQAIGAKLGKADLDRGTVWGGGVRPEDFEKLIQEMRAKGNRTQSFGPREKLFAVQMWYENVLTPDLVESHTKVQEYAQKAGMTVSKIDQFFATAKAKFQEANGPGADTSGMNAWNDVAKMSGDARIEEQGRTRDFVQGGPESRSDMTVAKFRELGGVLSSYELQKLIRLEGKEAEFKALIEGGMSEEAALREMVKRGLDQAVLPWNEGAKTFKPKVDSLVQQEAQNMPGMAGTSGTTARMVTTGGMLGVAAPRMLKAMLGMLLPIRAHSFMEVVRGSGVAHSFGGTVDDYTSVVPGCNSLDAEGFQKAKRSEAALASGGGGGGSGGST